MIGFVKVLQPNCTCTGTYLLTFETVDVGDSLPLTQSHVGDSLPLTLSHVGDSLPLTLSHGEILSH